MKKNFMIIAAVLVLLALGGVAYMLAQRDWAVSEQQQATSSVNKDSMMYKMYDQLKGDDYDRMFIANMIEHHQGAVDMAKLALDKAKHQEIKDMAYAIIATQTKEIADMQAWQKQWGYGTSSGEMMSDHSAMGMMGEMTGVTERLKDLSGDAFDAAFLSSMIEHHQSAVDMAYPGMTNAKHDDVKRLTKAVVDAQSKEITTMKRWQADWNYGNDDDSSSMHGMSH